MASGSSYLARRTFLVLGMAWAVLGPAVGILWTSAGGAAGAGSATKLGGDLRFSGALAGLLALVWIAIALLRLLRRLGTSAPLRTTALAFCGLDLAANVGGAFLSRIAFWVRRRLASSSPT